MLGGFPGKNICLKNKEVRFMLFSLRVITLLEGNDMYSSVPAICWFKRILISELEYKKIL